MFLYSTLSVHRVAMREIRPAYRNNFLTRPRVTKALDT